LLGSKAIKIVPSDKLKKAVSGDTLTGSIETDMISSIMNEISPVSVKVESVITTLDSVGNALYQLLAGPELKESLRNIEDLTASLKNQLSNKGNLHKALQNFEALSDSISNNTHSINQTITNLEGITNDLNDAEIDSLFADLNKVALNLNNITESISSGKGSIGKLINEDSIYRELNIFITDLDSLINDINENPKKYVQFSLF
ncbi:MAG TPA: hypothetical protein VJ951_01505, partial [Bacteroidales bacterium]|nr:hypothetical protein [Bacteroidales bacterium]